MPYGGKVIITHILTGRRRPGKLSLRGFSSKIRVNPESLANKHVWEHKSEGGKRTVGLYVNSFTDGVQENLIARNIKALSRYTGKTWGDIS